jgi:hypothetical protein
MKAIGIGALVLLSACAAGSGNKANDAGMANGADAANLALPDCPEERLSCGKQRPVVSDGVTRFRNEDLYLRAVFPSGEQVCFTR